MKSEPFLCKHKVLPNKTALFFITSAIKLFLSGFKARWCSGTKFGNVSSAVAKKKTMDIA